jgi:MoxR-like ATPase
MYARRMADTGVSEAASPSLRLEDSAAATRAAVASLVAPGSVPSSIEVDGRKIAVEGTHSGARVHVNLAWPGGTARFRVGLHTASNDRRNPEDHGHRESIQVWSEDGSREVGWSGLEWFVRDAIREGRGTVPVRFWTSFMERGAAEDETGIGNAELGQRARELCARSGLGEGTWVEVGAYDLEARRWTPEPSTVLGRLLTVAFVKTVLRDRGRGTLIAGEAPFPIRTPTSAAHVAVPVVAQHRLAGLHRWYGPGAAQVESVREALRFVAEERPTTELLEAWMREQGGLEHTRLDVYTRPLLQLELAARDDADRWSLTDLGAEFVESGSPELLYRAYVAHYVGFEETLAFFGRHPEGDADALLEDLNARLGTTWERTVQASCRSTWLRAFGLLEGERGVLRLSASGKRIFDDLPAALKHDLAVEELEAEATSAEPEPQPQRLLADDVVMGDLLVEASLVPKCIAALNAGKHLLLIGPPGTGKSQIASRVARYAAELFGLDSPLLATASADWTAYDTIGGWTQRQDHTLAFRAGVFTRAIHERRWLVLDELNRADVDKCLGEAFTVLAGGEVETAFADDDGPVRVGARSKYDPGDWFRVIATMNVRDKATLFRLSYALLRRFAIIEVPAPDDATLRAIARADAERIGVAQQYADLGAGVFTREVGLGDVIELGPAMLRDMIAYAKHRGASDLAIAEGFELFVLPQLDGLEAADAKRARAKLAALFGVNPDARTLVLRRFESYFPHVAFDG